MKTCKKKHEGKKYCTNLRGKEKRDEGKKDIASLRVRDFEMSVRMRLEGKDMSRAFEMRLRNRDEEEDSAIVVCVR